jgi:glycosyltransferase involved in cell wall biosynthesis
MSKTKLRPSIIIPTLNAASLLAPLISLLREQSQKPLEIIVIDSSSDDGTADLAQRMTCGRGKVPPRTCGITKKTLEQPSGHV